MKSTVQYIISWGGKATGKYRNFLNIKDKETDQIKSIDWKEEVKEWVPVNIEQVLLTGLKLQDLRVAEANSKNYRNGRIMKCIKKFQMKAKE